MAIVHTIFLILGAFITSRSTIAAENLVLRHQLGVLQRSVKRLRLRQRDRILWVWLSRLWANWRSCLMIVKPDTVLRWHRGGIYGVDFRERVKHMGIAEVVIAYRSSWQSPYVERLIGSIRRECLNHVIVLNEAHLRRILTSCFAYYHEARTHLSLDRNAPIPRKVEAPSCGRVIAIPQVGGLRYRHTLAA